MNQKQEYKSINQQFHAGLITAEERDAKRAAVKAASNGKGTATLIVPDAPIRTSTAQAMTGDPVQGAAKLAGGEGAAMLSAGEFAGKVISLYQSTDVGTKRSVGLLELFKSVPQDTVKDALNNKKRGFPRGSLEAGIITESNTLYRGYLANPREVEQIMRSDVIEMEDGRKVYGWRARVDAVRMVMEQKRIENAIRAKAADMIAAVDDDDETSVAEIKAQAADLIAEERAKKTVERETAKAQGAAAAKRLLKAHAKLTPGAMLVWLKEYRQAFDVAVLEWKGENSAAIATEEAEHRKQA